MEEKVNLKQAFVLLAGLILIFLWFQPNKTQQTEPRLLPPAQISERLIIPKLSLDAPIVFSDSNDETKIQNYLQVGIVHLKDTAMPGEAGNAYIVGHSSDYMAAAGNYKTIFAKLPKLASGDEIIVKQQNKELHFNVTETKVVEAGDLSVLSQETQGRVLLTLQTSYPVGTAKRRFIVISELVRGL